MVTKRVLLSASFLSSSVYTSVVETTAQFFPGPRACNTAVQHSSKAKTWREHHLDEQRTETANELPCFFLGATRENSPT